MSDHEAKATDLNDDAHLGLAGRTARFFIKSPLSPLFFFAMMIMGIMGLFLTPRQEDPQISVPMVDIFVQYPGASAEQVAALAIQPLERIMSEIPSVKHVYSASQRGMGMVTIEFEVGEEMTPSLVKVNDKLDSNMDKIPPGVMPPLVQAKGIDDVPVVNITLWSKDLDQDGYPDVDDGQLRMLAHDVLQSIKEIPDTGNGFVVGGRAEQVTVEVFPEQLSGYNISLDQVANTIRTANSEMRAGGVESGNLHFSVVSGAFLKTVDDIARLVVGTYNNSPVYVHDVARVVQGPEDARQLVAYYTGPAGPSDLRADGMPAVTIAVAKKEKTNGVTVADGIIKRVEELKGVGGAEGARIPSNVAISITRNYGATAKDKVNELIFKLFMATGFVFLLVWWAFRALRPAIVVVLVIPVVLLFTIFTAFVTGYTIDRVSLFALIFSIGILVDDAIVVVENIYRRWLEEGKTDVATAVDAVREVGNPTILATFTVIGALLPMGFVRGMMGPYMEPIPALGSAAMLISLFAAFVFTPWLSISPWLRPTMSYLKKAEVREHAEAERWEGLYRRILTPLIESKRKQMLFRLILWGSFFAVCTLFYFKLVAVKMLPLDNKPEFSVVLDMPEGTALPVTANLAHRIAEKLRQIPEVTALQVYAGTAKPFDFNGMVRHYYLRKEPWQGEVQVQLTHKKQRKRSSHQIAVQARADLQELLKGTGARISVVEMPPGPPVLQSVVAEVHGPSDQVRRRLAQDLTHMFEQAPSLTDVDSYLREPSEYWRFFVDTEKAVRRGISVDAINRNLAMALGGSTVGDVKQRTGHEPVNIVIQVPLAERSQVARLGDLPVQPMAGAAIPLRELGRFERVAEEDIIYHKDLRAVEYVVAEVGGALAAPVYGMMQVQDLLKDYTAPDGVKVDTYWLGAPSHDRESSIEWTGEWTVTFETFRDMGGAFVVALVLIYILVVWEFGNFRIPALIMAPIPLTLLGIIPTHMVVYQLGLGGEFTATSMIGWIALAGIIVRNSILLVDFSIHEIQRGIPVAEAVIRACKTRTRPILITALALVCGSGVILTDPIFQGMAISLASGVLVSTILTLVVIPLGCINASKALYEVAAVGAGAAMLGESAVSAGPAAKPAKPAPAAPAKTPLLIRIWGGVASGLLMGFYLVRGLFLLVGQALSGLMPKRQPPVPPPSPARPAPAPEAPKPVVETAPAPAPAVAPAPAPVPEPTPVAARVEVPPAEVAVAQVLQPEATPAAPVAESVPAAVMTEPQEAWLRDMLVRPDAQPVPSEFEKIEPSARKETPKKAGTARTAGPVEPKAEPKAEPPTTVVPPSPEPAPAPSALVEVTPPEPPPPILAEPPVARESAMAVAGLKEEDLLDGGDAGEETDDADKRRERRGIRLKHKQDDFLL